MAVALARCFHRVRIVDVEGALRVPVTHDVRHNVRGLLRRGEREIVLDLAGVSRIDAAGIGELVRVYNMTMAVNGFVRIVHASGWVRELLERVGVLDLFTADARAA